MRSLIRTDLSCAYHMAVPTRYSLQEVKEFANETVGANGILSISDRMAVQITIRHEFLGALCFEYRDIFIDASRLAHLLDAANSGQREWLSTHTLHEATLFIGYQLVSASPQSGSEPDNDINTLARLGLIMFCLSFFRNFDAKIIESSSLGTATSLVVLVLKRQGLWVEELVLWVLCLGHAVQIFGHTVMPSVMHRARLSVDALQLTSWDDTAQLLTKFPWSNALYGNAGKTLWDLLVMLPDLPPQSTRFDAV